MKTKMKRWRQLTSLLLAAIMCLTNVRLALAETVVTPDGESWVADVYYEEDFEDVAAGTEYTANVVKGINNGGLAGSTVQAVEAGENNKALNIVSAGESGDGYQVNVRWSDANSWNENTCTSDLSAKTVVYEFDIKLCGDDNGLTARLRSKKTVEGTTSTAGETVLLTITHNALSTVGNSNNVELTSGKDAEWHRIAIVCDFSTEKYDIYLDNEILTFANGLSMYNAAAFNPAEVCDFLRFGSGSSYGLVANILIDNLRVYEKIAPGYTAGISTTNTTVYEDDQVVVNVAVGREAETNFAAGELVVSYDSSNLEFNRNASQLGANTTVKVENGTLTLEDYGADKDFGDAVYQLVFTATAEGSATVTLDSAAFVSKENAVKSDLIGAMINPASVTVTINKKLHAVTLPDIFTGAAEIEDESDYTFSAKDSVNYTYSGVTATMGGQNKDVTDNGDGTYTIENVTGALVITGTRTEKSYDVTFAGNAAADIIDGAATATYNTAYTFTMPSVDNWAYSLDSITIDGVAYKGYSVENSVYTIPGTAIAGDIVITVSKVQTEASVTVEGTGAGAAAGYGVEVSIGENYTLTIVPEVGYTYTVSATMNGETATVVDNGDNTYTINSVNGDVVFTVNRTVITSGVTVENKAYLTVSGSNMWLVKNDTTVASGKVPTYNGDPMFWSEKYDAYCYLVVAETLSVEDAKAQIGIAEGASVSVDYGKDVNMTGKVDASDAQLTYNMYRLDPIYSGFSADVTMVKFLRADVNGDSKVDVNDATAIISSILGTN